MKVFLSIEVTSRELESRTLLASYAVKNGFDVIMGRKKELIEQALVSEPGIFLSQWGLHRNFKKLYETLKSLGHTIICIDEEGLVTFREFEDYVSTKVDIECLELVDKILLWGTTQENNFKNRFSEHSLKFEAVGNPRDDILSNDFEQLFAINESISSSSNSAPITFVSSFGFANHVEGADEYFKRSIQSGVFFNKKVEKIYSNYLSFQKDNFVYFVNLLKNVATIFPNKNIIYRFHPGEDRNILVAELKSYKNISFSSGGALIPLLKISKVVVHHLCHAGIEAQILGKITIAFRPKKNAQIEDERVYAGSLSMSTEAEVISFMENLFASPNQSFQGQTKLMSNDFIFRAANDLSSERIVKNFTTLAKKNVGRKKKHFLIFKKRLKIFVKRLRVNKNMYTKQKSEGLSYDSIRSILDTILDVAPRATEYIKLEEITSHVFKLTAKK